MLRAIALAALALACSSAEAPERAPVAAAPAALATEVTKPASMHFQVDPASVLFAPAQAAAADWSAALGRDVTASADGDVPILRVEGNCSDSDASRYFVVACAKDIRTPDARIEVSSDTAVWELYTALKHEMGHQLAGNSLHVEHEPEALMYYYKPLGSPNVITSDDRAYVCRGFACAGD